MQYEQRNFNSTVKTTILLLVAFVFSFQTFAQGPLEIKSSFKRTKIDGVSAVVGDYVILDSDIDKTLVDMKSQGIPTDGIELEVIMACFCDGTSLTSVQRCGRNSLGFPTLSIRISLLVYNNNVCKTTKS